MVAPAFDSPVLTQMLDLYEREGFARRASMPDQGREAGAPSLFDLESRIALGMTVYGAICRLDEEWSRAVQTGVLPVKEEDARRIGHLYATWLKPHIQIMSEIKEVASGGTSVLDADRFREAVFDVKSKLSIPIERLYKAAPLGRTQEELRDAVRGRLER
jgi:hypothetical protein